MKTSLTWQTVAVQMLVKAPAGHAIPFSWEAKRIFARAFRIVARVKFGKRITLAQAFEVHLN